MADENKEQEQVGGLEEPEPPSKGDGGLGLGDDLLDLFTEDDVVNEHLTLLTASLEDVDINDLLEQVRELQDIINERR